MADQKQYAPSRRKLKQARAEGKVLKSAELSHTLVMIVGVFGTILGLRLGWVSMRKVLDYTLVAGAERPTVMAAVWAWESVKFLFGVLGAMALTAIAVEALQVGFSIQYSNLRFRFSRLSPFQGISRMGVSLRGSWVSLLKSVLFVLLGWICLSDLVALTVALCLDSLFEGRLALKRELWRLIGSGFALLLFCAMADYLMVRRRYYRELSMSREEMVLEQREEEGDAHMKSLRKALHQHAMLQDVVRRVRQAKVIVLGRS